MKSINIPGILADALSKCEADADFDRCLRDATARACGDDPDALDEVVSVLERLAERHDVAAIDAARRYGELQSEEGAPAAGGFLSSPWQKVIGCVVLILAVGMPIGYRMWKAAKRGGDSELISIKNAVDAYDRRHQRVESDAVKAIRKVEEKARTVVAARTLVAMRESIPPSDGPDDPLVRQHTANVTRYMNLTGLKGTVEELREIGTAGEVLAKEFLLREDLSKREQVGGRVLLGLFLLAQERLDDAERAALDGQALDDEDPRPDMLLARIAEQRGKYDEGIAADERALVKFEPWWASDWFRLQGLLWMLGRERIVDDLRWQREVENIIRDVRRTLKTHVIRMQAHKGVEAVKDLLRNGSLPPLTIPPDGEPDAPAAAPAQPSVDSGGK